MCEKSPGPRCASDTCETSVRARDEYTAAFPDGPDVVPLDSASFPRDGNEALEALFEGIGYVSPGRAELTVDMHRDLLATPEGLNGLAEQLRWSKKPERRDRLMRAFRLGHDEYTFRHGVEPTVENEPDGWRDVEPLSSPSDITKASFGLYGYDRAPLRNEAREAMRKYMSTIKRFPPGEGRTVTIESREIAARLGADFSDVPDDAFAFDIESDTSEGHGLQPHRAPVTELVLTTKDETIVLSGDEKHILQGFADFMNRQERPMTAFGWNSRSFDIPYLHLRARVHDLDGWALQLADSDVPAPYSPTGGFRHAQRMRWCTPGGVVHYDEDLMLTYSEQRGVRSARLKDSAEEHGMTPVRVDREKLHELSQAERDEYVCSDGLATLHLVGVTRRHQAQAAMQEVEVHAA